MSNAKNIKNVFPRIFCLEDIQCSPDEEKGFNYRATLYHDQACITVSFNCAERDPHLEKGILVSVRWLPMMHSDHGAIQIAGLAMQNRTVDNFNPFLIVPHTWSIDRHLINCARDLWGISSKEMRRLLCATVLTQTNHSGRQ